AQLRPDGQVGRLVHAEHDGVVAACAAVAAALASVVPDAFAAAGAVTAAVIAAGYVVEILHGAFPVAVRFPRMQSRSSAGTARRTGTGRRTRGWSGTPCA